MIPTRKSEERRAKQWIYPYCRVNQLSGERLQHHLRDSHNLQLTFGCPDCHQRDFANLKSVSSHMRYCTSSSHQVSAVPDLPVVIPQVELDLFHNTLIDINSDNLDPDFRSSAYNILCGTEDINSLHSHFSNLACQEKKKKPSACETQQPFSVLSRPCNFFQAE